MSNKLKTYRQRLAANREAVRNKSYQGDTRLSLSSHPNYVNITDNFDISNLSYNEALELLDNYNPQSALELLDNYNPYRDEKGRFATADTAAYKVDKGSKEKTPVAKKEGAGPSSTKSIAKELTSPTVGPVYKPDVDKKAKNGVTEAARVGIPAMKVLPPPPVGSLPNLTYHERAVETSFRDTYHSNPNKIADEFRKDTLSKAKPGEAPVFNTDDAKALSPDWNHPDLGIRSKARATLNNALHGTANAIAKKAFVDHLDTLKPGDEVCVTVGGCGAGKGYGLKNVPQALEAKNRSKAVWDSAGDQNATENPWIQKECEKRGLKANYIFVHADPFKQWADPERGVVKRAGDPSDGRMVDAKVFADSYAIGAKNHQAFYQANKNNPNANFEFISNIGKPTRLDGIPKEALKLDRKKLADFATKVVMDGDAPDHIKRGATAGARIWPKG